MCACLLLLLECSSATGPLLAQAELYLERHPEVDGLAVSGGGPKAHLLDCDDGLFVKTVRKMRHESNIFYQAVWSNQGACSYDSLHFVTTGVLGVVRPWVIKRKRPRINSGSGAWRSAAPAATLLR